MLVSECIDRTYNEWLYPAGINRPTYDLLEGSLANSASALAFAVEGRLEGDIPRDTVVEIDDELILIQNVTDTAITANERGYLESDIALHADGARVLVDPRFPRKAVFNSLSAVIGQLYPKGIYARTTGTATFTNQNVLTLPTGAKKLLGVLVRSTGDAERYLRLNPARGDYQVYMEFTPPKVHLYRGEHDATVTWVYARDFVRPTATTQDLTNDCLVPDSLAAYLPQAVAGQLLMTRELPRVLVEEIRRFLSSQGVQVGAALNVGQALLQDFDRRHVAAERQRLHELDPTGFEFVSLR